MAALVRSTRLSSPGNSKLPMPVMSSRMKPADFCASRTALLKNKLDIHNQSRRIFTDITVKGTQSNPQVTVNCDTEFYRSVTRLLLDYYSQNGLQGECKSVPDISTTVVVLKKGKPGKTDYTINLYHTTQSMLANGGAGATSSFADHLRLAVDSGVDTDCDSKSENFDELSTSQSGNQSGGGDSYEPDPRPINHSLVAQTLASPFSRVPGCCQHCDFLQDELSAAKEAIADLKATQLKMEASYLDRIKCLEVSMAALMEQAQPRPNGNEAQSDKMRSCPEQWTEVVKSPSRRLTKPDSRPNMPTKSLPTSHEKASRPPRTKPDSQWAPERCLMITEYNDKLSARSLAGIRTAISKFSPGIRIETVHRPRSGKLIVQLESADAVAPLCDTWNSDILGGSVARKLQPKPEVATKFLAGVPTFIEMEVVEASVADLYNIDSDSVHAYRFKWNGAPGQTIKVEINGAENIVKVDSTTRWVKVGDVSVRVDNPHSTRRHTLIQCTNCCKFGHGSLKCPNDPVCPTCSLSHPSTDCPGTTKCVNCSQSHHSTFHKCPKRLHLLNKLNIHTHTDC